MKKMQSENEGAIVITTLSINFLEAQGQLIVDIGDGIQLKFKLIQALTGGLITCKNEEDSFKNEGTRVVTTISSTLILWILCLMLTAAISAARGLIWQNFKPI